MTLVRVSALFAAACLSTAALAQPAPQPQDQAPTGPPGRMMGPGRGMGMGPGAQNTTGWSLMSPAERQAHMARMHSFTSRKDCEAYVAEHHRLMAERAKAKGMAMPAQPRGAPCAGLK